MLPPTVDRRSPSSRHGGNDGMAEVDGQFDIMNVPIRTRV
jgi:hypothetical protein